MTQGCRSELMSSVGRSQTHQVEILCCISHLTSLNKSHYTSQIERRKPILYHLQTVRTWQAWWLCYWTKLAHDELVLSCRKRDLGWHLRTVCCHKVEGRIVSLLCKIS
jgi:hypothetical protein